MPLFMFLFHSSEMWLKQEKYNLINLTNLGIDDSVTLSYVKVADGKGYRLYFSKPLIKK